jgi:DNA modification methylase
MSTKVLDQKSGNGWVLYNADAVDVCNTLPDDSIDFSIFSPPFASLYTYSNSSRDMGNCANDAEFQEHFSHVLRPIFRALRPGRLMAMHCMLLPSSKTRDGYIGLKDFRGDIIRAAQREGFVFHSEVCIWTNPVTAMQRTKALGLLHKTIRKDSAQSRTGIPDYLVVMVKPGANDKPIAHTAEEFPVERWQRYASPVWATIDGVDDDGFLTFRDPHKGDGEHESSGIDRGDTLQYMSAREDDDERHICPLQLGIIRRAMRLWTRPDDVVLSPFAGIGSEGYVALQEGRKFVGAELKRSYFNLNCRNLAAAEPNAKGSQMRMFA